MSKNEKQARRAVSLALMGRESIESAIEQLDVKLEAVRSGCVDFDLGEALLKMELRMFQLVLQLERFEREVAQPAEELHRRTITEDLDSSVRFSDSSGEIRTNVSIRP
jgi:hypothetical protein